MKLLLVYFRKHLPKRQRTKSIEGRDCNALSDNTSQGAAAGGIGYTVKRHPHPFTELSLTNFHRSSSPLMRSSLDQSDHSRPERTETTRPVLSIMVRGSCLGESKPRRIRQSVSLCGHRKQKLLGMKTNESFIQKVFW